MPNPSPRDPVRDHLHALATLAARGEYEARVRREVRRGGVPGAAGAGDANAPTYPRFACMGVTPHGAVFAMLDGAVRAPAFGPLIVSHARVTRA